MGTLDSIAHDNQKITWQLAHAALSRLARERAAADAEEGRWLLAAERAAVHVHLGFSAFNEYIERLFGYKPRSVQEKLRVAQALEGLPALSHALSGGELSWSAVRELTRVVVSETEHEWLEFARGKTLRQLEQVLAGRRQGAAPGSAPDPAAQRHVLRFEVAAESFALFRDALRELRRRAGASLDDDSALLELARCVLGGPKDEGRASYQMVLAVCPECSGARQHSEGGLVPVGSELIRMAQCDAQHVPATVDPGTLPANDLELHEVAEAPDSDPAAGATESAAHAGAASRVPSAPRRATQTIAPALRRAVLLRDQSRCQVPGCQNTSWLDLHHLEPRSEGGRHSLDNLIGLCGLCRARHNAARTTAPLIAATSFSIGPRAAHCAPVTPTAVHTALP